MSEQSLTFERLQRAVDRGVAAIRTVTRLQPAGGPGDKVFPPTYTKDGKYTKYAEESRRINGQEVHCVLLDSVASQANRMEQALLQAWRRGELRFPLARVDFSGESELADIGEITALDAPHRIADAIFRDSLLEGTPFRDSEVGQAITDARVDHASAMYRYCPTALLFGVWDSTGPKGGSGAKFQRALVSEIVGMDAISGVKTTSRIDPLQVQRGVPVYHRKDNPQDWTIDEKAAQTAKGKPMLFSRKGEGKGTPSAINHSNIPPSVDAKAGGVTIDHALQTTVLSLPALRRLRFRIDLDGQAIPADRQDAAEMSARTNLAALALCAVVFAREHGYDLRSRALLVPDGPLVLELVPTNGSAAERYQLSPDQAATLLEQANESAIAQGLGWSPDPIELRPSEKLAELVRRSRKLTSQGEGEDSE